MHRIQTEDEKGNITLTFSNIEESEALRLIKSLDMALALSDLSDTLRNYSKYGLPGEQLTNQGEKMTPADAIDMIRDELMDTLHSRDLDIDELIS